MSKSLIFAKELSTIGKGIWCHIEDSHEFGAVQSDAPVCTNQSDGIGHRRCYEEGLIMVLANGFLKLPLQFMN